MASVLETVFLSAAGIAILTLTLLDFGLTTISGNGSGPLTKRISRAVWVVMRASIGWIRPAAVRHAVGPTVMAGTALSWIILTALGWLLIFCSWEGAVVVSDTERPADWLQILAFVGSALSTVGASNAEASNTFWDNAAMVAAVNGMVVLTLSVTFVLNVTQTVVSGRGFSALVRSCDLSERSTDDMLLPILASLCFQLKAYPLAIYYSADRSANSITCTLLHLARCVAEDPERASRYLRLLNELPGVSPVAESNPALFLQNLESWRNRHSLH